MREISKGLRIFRFNPYFAIDTFFRRKRSKNEDKMLQLKLAILTGGIKKVK